jgi:protein involved in sex pheromone biosynthesis
MPDRIDYFLAHVISVGKTNLTAEGKERLQKLADRWIRVSDRVRANVTDATGQVIEVVGTVSDANDEFVKVTLDTPIEVNSSAGMVGADQITLPADSVTKYVEPTPAPAP